MHRIVILLALVITTTLNACGQKPATKQSMETYPLQKTEAEWKAELGPDAYRVLREKGTERAFTGAYHDNHDKGTYKCNACHTPLFSSDQKFDSGTGWPSFFDVVKGGKVKSIVDKSHGMVRTEVVCGNCGGHLGHVFDDGPNPTGLRYCINSVSLEFEKGK